METPTTSKIQKCGLCLKELNYQTEVMSTIKSCNHIFHTDCFTLWCIRFSTCPTCGEDIDSKFCAKCFTKITKYYDLIRMKPCGHMYHIQCVETAECLHCN